MDMEENLINEICKDLKWHEKFRLKLFKNLFLKIYNNERTKIVNALLK